MSGQEQDIRVPVAAKLIAEMERTRMTNQQLAQAINTSERQITRWRSGQEPSYRFVTRLARVFGRDPSWFYELAEEATS